ncbi:MAG TPA: CPBP family glutamic-type intramembrane protease [Verrucomicrobiota bacterium]|nr:CPBP family glutamic-type intramembrane protease [Verrucomicrobiota bacterium]
MASTQLHSPQARRLWLALAPALVLPCLGSLAYFVLFKESTLVKVLYGGTKAFTLIWPALALTLILQQRLPRPLLHRRDLDAIPLGAASGLLIGLALVGLAQTALSGVISSGVPSIRVQAERFDILDHYWLFALLLSSVHAFVEEYYWRWFVYGQLRQLLPPAGAHAVAGAAFAAHHVVITGVYFGWGWGVVFGAGVGLGGVLWSMMYERQGTLTGAWISHVIVDLAIMAVGHRALWGRWI